MLKDTKTRNRLSKEVENLKLQIEIFALETIKQTDKQKRANSHSRYLPLLKVVIMEREREREGGRESRSGKGGTGISSLQEGWLVWVMGEECGKEKWLFLPFFPDTPNKSACFGAEGFPQIFGSILAVELRFVLIINWNTAILKLKRVQEESVRLHVASESLSCLCQL